jgi:hypothetical protein
MRDALVCQGLRCEWSSTPTALLGFGLLAFAQSRKHDRR